MELIAQLIFAVVVGFALLIIGGVVAAEALAALECRKHRRKPEADVSEIPEDPRERMVPKCWRNMTTAAAEQAPKVEFDLAGIIEIMQNTPPRIQKIYLNRVDFDRLCSQHLDWSPLYPSKAVAYMGVQIERSNFLRPGEWIDVYDDGRIEPHGGGK